MNIRNLEYFIYRYKNVSDKNKPRLLKLIKYTLVSLLN